MDDCRTNTGWRTTCDRNIALELSTHVHKNILNVGITHDVNNNFLPNLERKLFIYIFQTILIQNKDHIVRVMSLTYMCL